MRWWIIPLQNSTWHMALTLIGISEPSLVVWLWGRLTKDSRCLLQWVAFCELRNFDQDLFPTNHMVYDTHSHTWGCQGDVMRKKRLGLGKKCPAWWWGTIDGVRIVYYHVTIRFFESTIGDECDLYWICIFILFFLFVIVSLVILH